MTDRELLHQEIDTMSQQELTEIYTAIQEIRHKKTSRLVAAPPIITRSSHILSGEPIISGTRTSVRAVVENWRMGISPEEIPLHLPHLTLAQVFGALGYYSEHQEEINAYIEKNHIPDHLLDPLLKVA